jgi:hypothetical protein
MKHKHRPCPCGCGELADECMKPSSGLNAFQIGRGFAPLTDDDAVDAENNRHQGAHNHLADDEWDDLPVPGGDAA